MIKFFRQIRQSLIMENKTSKYFKYAIGEIILVVIGILIALQINNWNDDKKINNLKLLQLESIEQDLKKDVSMIKSLVDLLEGDLKIYEQQNIKLQLQDATINTLIEITKNDFNPRLRQFYGFESSTYKSLVSTGAIDFFEETIKKDLSELNTLQEKAIRNIDVHFQYYLNVIQPHLAQFPIQYPIIPISKGPLYEKLWKNLDEEALIISYNEVGSARSLYCVQTLGSLLPVLDKTNSILELYFND